MIEKGDRDRESEPAAASAEPVGIVIEKGDRDRGDRDRDGRAEIGEAATFTFGYDDANQLTSSTLATSGQPATSMTRIKRELVNDRQDSAAAVGA